MKNLYFEPESTNEPKVEFNAETGICMISGDCYPETGYYFFENLHSWINNYITEVKGSISFTINLRYFNTSSSRGLFILITILKKYKDEGGNVKLMWHYDKDDEYMLEEIKGYGEEANIDIIKIPEED